MKPISIIILSLFPFFLFGQNEDLFDGLYYSTVYMNNGSDPYTGGTDVTSNGDGTGSFEGGTFVYTLDDEYFLEFTEDIGGDNIYYIGATDSSGEYAILIPDPTEHPEDGVAIATATKLSTGKTNANFAGEYLTSYYRYSSTDDWFAGLFAVTADGEDTCTYHMIAGTEATGDQSFRYELDNEGRILLYNNSGTKVISASLNETDDFYGFASEVNGFPAVGYGVRNAGEFDVAELKGEYKLMQIRYSPSYLEESASLITINLLADGTGTYQVDTNTHGENTTGTLEATYYEDGLWTIELDDNPITTILCAINPDEKLITGYFNHGGGSPGILFGIPHEIPVPRYSVSGTVNGTEGVIINIGGDISASLVTEGGTFSFMADSSASFTITPLKEGYTFSPESITVNNINQDSTLAELLATINTYTITGTVTNTDAVVISMTGDQTDSETIDMGWTYSFIASYGDSIQITPARDGFIFDPENIVIPFVNSDSTLQSFSGSRKIYTVSGTISGADGVLITATGDVNDSQTIDEGEQYSFEVEFARNIVITPSKNGYSFDPANITIESISFDELDQDFVSEAIIFVENNTGQDFTIHPNPVEDYLNIELEGVTTIEIIDISGKVLDSYPCSGKTSLKIDMRSFKPGQYFIQSTSKASTHSRIIIKQ